MKQNGATLTMFVGKFNRDWFMRTAMSSFLCVCALFFVDASPAQNDMLILDRGSLSSRAHNTWEGSFKFSGLEVVKIEGMKDLYVLFYRNLGRSEGNLVEFAEAIGQKQIKILLQAEINIMGVVPVLEGLDVLPGVNDAEIIVRWRHPGNGGYKSVIKYNYTQTGLILARRSEFTMVEGAKKWISEDDLNRKETEIQKRPPVD